MSAWRAQARIAATEPATAVELSAAGVDPVVGDHPFVTALIVAQTGCGGLAAFGSRRTRARKRAGMARAGGRGGGELRGSSSCRTTALTRRFLARAQEQAHQDMAPVLAATLRGWLPAVTRGRYVDATVDPETLAIQVYGSSGRWRPADRLSAGTTDQVYLLLRVALAQHLATTGETCPLLLDGVTAQSDDERTREILDLLLRLAAERQVVLFTQEEAVLRWAREHVDGDRHFVRELTRVPVA